MMQLGNLAIVAANHKDCMLQIYDNEVTVHTGQGTERKSISCDVRDNDYINKIISELVKTKPAWITIENLNVSGMMKNRHLSKAIGQQNFFAFRTKLTAKCKEYGIELRIAERFYPSSKTCHHCGHIKTDLKLSDRKFVCDCGYTADRDYNASLNLRDCQTYEVA